MPSVVRSLRPWAVTLLVPALFAGELLLPAHSTLHLGVGVALGCSGAGNAAPRPQGFTLLRATRYSSSDAPIPIATDGFFVIEAEVAQLDADTTLRGLEVVVTDEQGGVVEGEIQLLLERQADRYLFGWSASSPLTVGAKLRATLRGTPVSVGDGSSIGSEHRLVVVGAPTPLPEPAFDFGTWFDFYHGEEGPTLSCSFDASGCGPARELDVPANIVEQNGAYLVWHFPAITGGVAWALRIEPAASELDARVLENFLANAPYLGGAGAGETTRLGGIAFPTPGDEHCAAVVIRDLRTSEEVRVEKCASLQAAASATSDTALASCREPPSEDLKEAWCRLRGLAEPQCSPMTGGGGSSGVGGTAPGSGGSSLGSGGGTASSAGTGAGTVSGGQPAPSAAEGSRTSQSCQLGGGSSPVAGGAGSLLVLAFLSRRRRRGDVRPFDHGPGVQ